MEQAIMPPWMPPATSVNAALLGIYAMVFAVSWGGVPFLTAPATYRTPRMPLSDTLDLGRTRESAMRALQCTDALPYDTTTSWAPGNASGACQCASGVIAGSPPGAAKREAIVSCFLNNPLTDVETSVGLGSSIFVANPAVLVGVWNSLAVIASTSHLTMPTATLAILFGVATGGVWAYPIYGIPYAWAVVLAVSLFAVAVGSLTLAMRGEATVPMMRDWVFWMFYSVALAIAVSIYNTLRLQRDLSANIVYIFTSVAMVGGAGGCRLMARASVDSGRVLPFVTFVNLSLVLYMAVIQFPPFDPLLYSADPSGADGAGGFTALHACHVGIPLMLGVLAIEGLDTDEKRSRQARVWTELVARVIVTLGMMVDLLWLSEVVGGRP